ncbi:hypothetical protein Calab_2915 [Caldithrix abyssi DSM 13497]|uniref:Uncharacterized protein n=1 Tax=Caldithrix abyssi DSM 13497 TaxID=880073 RepID=H1XS29_CALAY|nr:hypothetical protein Calab_2915 [Caldithrix abyssi DSM 13497]
MEINRGAVERGASSIARFSINAQTKKIAKDPFQPTIPTNSFNNHQSSITNFPLFFYCMIC